jgi:dolichol-phosphate hexosyltransferase
MTPRKAKRQPQPKPAARSPAKQSLRVTVVIPTLNEEGGIGPTLDSVDHAAFEAKGWDLDFLIIDGASKDRTKAEAEKRGARVIIEPRKGYGRAYKRGFAEAEGDILVTGDADGTYPFERAHEFVQVLLDEGLDFVNCDRYGHLEKGAMSAKHRFGNWVLSSTARVLFGIRLRDSQSGMWVIRRTALPKLDVERMAEGMAFSQEVKIEAIRRLDGRFKEIPAGLRPRIGTPVLASWRDGLGNLKALFSWRVNRR